MRARSHCPIPIHFKVRELGQLSRWLGFRTQALALLACWGAGLAVQAKGSDAFPHRRSVLLDGRQQTPSEDRRFL
jgi:hypothetical protein